VYLLDYISSNYHLFRSMQHDLADQHFRTYEEIKNDLMNGMLQRTNISLYCGIIAFLKI